MKDNLTRTFGRAQRAFAGFTPGQKVVAIVGTGALLLAGFMVFRWAAAPSYAPLYSNLASSDASAVIQQLDSSGVPYKLSGDGNTIMVPRDQVYTTRINLSGEGIPTNSGKGGYSLLDDSGISTSNFQEQTAFKRAMEGELANTIEAIDGVQTAIVHLAMPPKDVFSDTQQPTTASVLVQTAAGSTLTPEQVQTIVNLTSSSIDGLSPDDIKVSDGTGKVLWAQGAGAAGSTQAQDQQAQDFQDRMAGQIQATLDRIFGAGNAIATVTPTLDFDRTVSDTTRYFGKTGRVLSQTKSKESMTGTGSTPGTTGGVVGPDGQMDPGATGTGTGSDYVNEGSTTDYGQDKTQEHREAAPGSVQSIAVGVIVDTQSLAGRDLTVLEKNLASSIGIDPKRGDTIDVSDMPFDQTAKTAALEELKTADAAAKKAETMSLIRNGGLIGLLVLILLITWFQSRRRAKARTEATNYVVEQLRRDQLERQAAQAALEAPSPALLALEAADSQVHDQVRDEIAALVERQPEDVAALLRGWLVEEKA